MGKKPDNRDWHGDASFGMAEGCFWGLVITLVVGIIVLAVLKALGVI